VDGATVTEEEPDRTHEGQEESPAEEYLRAHTVGKLTALSSPIRIVDYDPGWPHRFELEADKIKSALGDRALRIEHVGSTSVPGLPAKPIVDILLVVASSAREIEYLQALESAAYQLHIREPGWHQHRMFHSPAKDVNLHVFSIGCPEIDRMLDFRERLRSNAGDRELYARAKRTLAQGNWKYTQDYADAKSGVIGEIVSRIELAKRPSTD
jgi:GrpB-like predicted nucleotidyltransferase (UPF0157 family)